MWYSYNALHPLYSKQTMKPTTHLVRCYDYAVLCLDCTHYCTLCAKPFAPAIKLLNMQMPSWKTTAKSRCSTLSLMHLNNFSFSTLFHTSCSKTNKHTQICMLSSQTHSHTHASDAVYLKSTSSGREPFEHCRHFWLQFLFIIVFSFFNPFHSSVSTYDSAVLRIIYDHRPKSACPVILGG